MKTTISAAVIGLFVTSSFGDPLITTWYTQDSGKYARIYQTGADQTAHNAVTTWSRGSGVQSSPAYAGVHAVSYSANWVYIYTSGLASYVMGPWYLNAAKTQLFP